MNLPQWQAFIQFYTSLVFCSRNLQLLCRTIQWSDTSTIRRITNIPALPAQGCSLSAYTNKEDERNFHDNYGPARAPSPALKRFKHETQPQLPAPADLYHSTLCESKEIRNCTTLTFWRRIFFQILAHPVFKM